MKTVLSSLNLVVGKQIQSELDAICLMDRMMIEEIDIKIKLINGKMISLPAMNWDIDDVEVLN